MEIVIGSVVISLWNMMIWKKASCNAVVIFAWSGRVLVIANWILGCGIQSGSITIDNVEKKEVELAWEHISLFHGHPFVAHWSILKCPLLKAQVPVSLLHGHLLAVSRLRILICPPKSAW